jgi:hypothetical protein
MQRLFDYHSTDPLAAERQRRVIDSTKHLRTDIEADVRDRLVVAALRTIQINEPLRDLAADPTPVTISRLREKVKDYSGIDASPIETEVEQFLPFLKRRKSKRAVRGVAARLDDLLDTLGPEPLKVNIVWETASRFQQILRVRRVSERDWERLLSRLVYRGMVVPSAPLYLWCNRCPDSGFATSFSPTYFGEFPYCPSCGGIAYGLSAFAPTSCLREAMELQDGVLDVAIGWFLRKRGIRFEHQRLISGTELDFLVSSPNGQVLVECKMHHVLSPQAQISRQILADRTQLREHIHAAGAGGIGLARACCVVNLSSAQLQRIIRQTPRERDAEYERLQAVVISYEEFADWLNEKRPRR